MKHFALFLALALSTLSARADLFRFKYDEHKLTDLEKKYFESVGTLGRWRDDAVEKSGSWPTVLDNNQTCGNECGEETHFKRVFDALAKKVEINSVRNDDTELIASVVLPFLDCLIQNPFGAKKIKPSADSEFTKMKLGTDDWKLTSFPGDVNCADAVYMQLFDFSAPRALKCAKQSDDSGHREVVRLWEYWLDATWKNLGATGVEVRLNKKCGNDTSCPLHFTRKNRGSYSQDLLAISSCTKLYTIYASDLQKTFKAIHAKTDGKRDMNYIERMEVQQMSDKASWSNPRNRSALAFDSDFMYPCLNIFGFDVPAAMEESKAYIEFEKKRGVISSKLHGQMKEEFDDVLKIWSGAFSLKMTSVFLSLGTVVFFLF